MTTCLSDNACSILSRVLRLAVRLDSDVELQGLLDVVLEGRLVQLLQLPDPDKSRVLRAASEQAVAVLEGDAAHEAERYARLARADPREGELSLVHREPVAHHFLRRRSGFLHEASEGGDDRLAL